MHSPIKSTCHGIAALLISAIQVSGAVIAATPVALAPLPGSFEPPAPSYEVEVTKNLWIRCAMGSGSRPTSTDPRTSPGPFR